MNLLLAFFLGAGISFIGSFQPGPVNLYVIQASYNRNWKTGIRAAFGGALPEIIYACCAFWFSFVFVSHPALVTGIRIASIPLLLASGLGMLIKKPKESKSPQWRQGNYLWSGFLLGILNPLLLPFWIFVTNWIRGYHLLNLTQHTEQLAFAIGCCIGAFLLLVILAIIAHKNRDFFTGKRAHLPNIIIAIIFILLGVHELIMVLPI